jgi:hypothetical protein
MPTPGSPEELCPMSDLIFLAASFAFFFVAVWYVEGCRHLKGGRDDA